MVQIHRISQDNVPFESRDVFLSASVKTPEILQPHLFETVRGIVHSFIQRASPRIPLNFDPPAIDELKVEVLKELEEINLALSLVKKWLTWSCQLVENFYPSFPVDLRVLITLTLLIGFYVEDKVSKTPEALHNFQLNILIGRPQPDEVLECFSKVIMPRMWNQYHPIVANAICIGIYEFIQGNAMEFLLKTIKHHPSAPEFPKYVRLKSGAPAPLAYWLFYNIDDIKSYIQIMPDFFDALNWINDILSFYKEEIDGEDNNFIHMRARATGKSIVTTLEETSEETIFVIQRISETLSGVPEYLNIFEGFVARYIRFHTSTTRYRLKELLMTENCE
ncbi:hypothetical protein Clacol_002406 [Clathrus columnatus]|uniref:Trichodiene synthase n=1 Tax=Clathrus columnatus TaxID=1419009 RepID=A0AAV5A4T1_9AGAM|nr:hypothetical protein Clacol_002406 [Clathrus columnatus]